MPSQLLREFPITCQECGCVIGINVEGGGVVIEPHHRHSPGCPKVKRVMDEVTRNNELSRRHFENEP
jgi:transcription initiation factor TFIIIB Brf1 subunit/transcription initiation factor TFIIB